MANKAETIKAVAARAGVTAGDADRTLTAFFDLVVEEVKSGGKVSWPGFGSFSMSERGARMGRNPQTGESIEIGPSRSLKLATASAMKKHLMS
ncbi:HU family DNA-binding protein [Candidatus Poriferisodalis sp.]|uniref:HU family DNA-binding protein n=1 Tax=Candidatus Poriferisodalis sp. TaxID=3101277 RepID=UPI003B02968D